jgi:hypothetical protein
MNVTTTVTGIGDTAQERAAVLIALAIARRGAELGVAPPRRPSVGGPAAATPLSSGGK